MSSIKFAVDHRILAGNSVAKELVDAIAQREDEIQQLKARLNDVLPMARIPDVILEEILFQVIRDIHLSSGLPISAKPYDNGTYSRWTSLTLVCCRFKDLVLNTPRLWSFVEYTRNHACMRGVIQRCKSVPIQILALPLRHAWNSDAGVEAVKELVSHLHRAYRFYLADGAHDHRIMRSLEGTVVHAPWLRSIRLARFTMGWGTTAHNVPLLSGSDFPCLQELHISDCSLQVLQAIVRPTLTSLVIRGSENYHFAYDPVSLLNVLNQTPLLRSFLIQKWVFNPNTMPAPADSAPHVQLPHLQTLRIEGLSTAIVEFLDRLTFPGSATVDIILQGHRYERYEDHLPSCQQFIQRLKHLGLFSPPSIHRLVLSKRDNLLVTVTGWSEPSRTWYANNDNAKYTSQPSFSISVYPKQLQTMWDIMPLEHVQELELKTYADCVFHFSGMTSLRSLTFCDTTTNFVHFIQHLSSPSKMRLDGQQLPETAAINAPKVPETRLPSVLFPNLIHLEINATSSFRPSETESRQDESKDRLDSLPPMLTWRQDHQHKQTTKTIALKGSFLFRAGVMDEFRAQFPDIELVDLFSQSA